MKTSLRVASRSVLAFGCMALFCGSALAATPLAPPAIYPRDTWVGKTVAVLRVLNRLDSHIETLRIPVNTTAHYQRLNLTPSRCLERPPTLPADAATWLDIEDTSTQSAAFHGWMLMAEPSLGIFESPVYDVRVIGCEGDGTAPDLPPLPKPETPDLPTNLPDGSGQTDPSSSPANITPPPPTGAPAGNPAGNQDLGPEQGQETQ